MLRRKRKPKGCKKPKKIAKSPIGVPPDKKSTENIKSHRSHRFTQIFLLPHYLSADETYSVGLRRSFLLAIL